MDLKLRALVHTWIIHSQSLSKTVEIRSLHVAKHGLGQVGELPMKVPGTAERIRESFDEAVKIMRKNWAYYVMSLWVPVSLCVAAVVLTIKTVKFYTEDIGETVKSVFFNPDDSIVYEVLASIGIATVLVISIIVTTTVLLLLYKYRCYKVIRGGLLTGSCLFLTTQSAQYINEVLISLNVRVSMPTVVFCLFNYVVVGMICIHWKGPLKFQQAFQISISALAALSIIKILPDWTLLAFLIIRSVWDLVDVLAPQGPLRRLVELEQERNESIFSSLSISCEPEDMEEVKAIGSEHDQRTGASSSKAAGSAESGIVGRSGGPVKRSVMMDAGAKPERTRQEDTEEYVVVESGCNELGLADFICYAVVVGKASTGGDWIATIACYGAILLGLGCTVIMGELFKKPLPALPIPIFAGLFFYFTTSFFTT